MKAKLKIGWLGLVTLVTCLMAGVAQAQSGIGNPNDVANGGKGNNYGWGDRDGTPAAPEPVTIVMAALGLAAVGGYVVYRRRRNGRTATSS
jgi:MYXO-CTERM domain-containing protein